MSFHMTTDTSNRQYELDWLRVGAILVVFLYHSTRFFNLGDWHVKNVNTYVWVEIWNVYATRWMMPLFFIISGASLFHAIGKTGGWARFYVDKILRLMIPVFIASISHAILQMYLERLTHGKFSGSFIDFIPEYFNGIFLDPRWPWNFAFHGMHLWYLLFLFVYGLICYRLFIWLKGSGQGILNRITTLFATPVVIYLWFAIPLLLMKALIPQAVLEVGAGGWGFLQYFWFLIAGFMIYSSDRLQKCIKNQRWMSLVLGIGLSSIYLYLLFGPSRSIFPAGIGDWVYGLLNYISAWTWIFAILGFGMRFLAFNSPVLRHTNEGVLPFYILHQTVLVGLGYVIMSWEIHDAFKWVIVFTSSFVVIMSLYLFLIRKMDLFRFMFGMKTSHPFYSIFRKKSTLAILHGLYIGIIAFVVFNQITGTQEDRRPMPITHDAGQDVILDAGSITDRSSTGIRVVVDEKASIGQAIEFSSGANQRVEPQPVVYFEMRFSAPAGRYTVWIRGKTDVDNGYTDSVWLQVDDQIGTRNRSIRMGNWLDISPAGTYSWAGDTDEPITIELKQPGEHKIRVQPRQTPHRIDQIWLSKLQVRVPDTNNPIK